MMLLVPSLALAAEQCLTCHPRHTGADGGCGSCHRGNPATARPAVAHRGLVAGRHLRFTRQGDGVAEGEDLVVRLGCRRCHAVAGRGNRLATDLDAVARREGSFFLIAALKRPAAAMPDFRLSDRQIDLLLNRLYAAAPRTTRSGEAPRVVHFRSGDGRGRDPFTIRCGPCHRALSRGAGSVGSGTVGPNLSGLFSPFYPADSPLAHPWTPKRLSTWLNNPRTVRPWSPMGPVPVSPRELEQIIAILSVSP